MHFRTFIHVCFNCHLKIIMMMVVVLIKKVVIIMVVLSGSFHKRWHNASGTQTQLCSEQLHGR